MSRFKILLAVTISGMALCWMITRTGVSARAAESTTPAVAVEEFGENTEDVALHRWQHNAPRHWRHLMVKR